MIHGPYYIARQITKSSPSCNEKDCSRVASHGPYGGSPIHCTNHRSIEEVNLIYKLCKEESCRKVALVKFNGLCRKHGQLD